MKNVILLTADGLTSIGNNAYRKQILRFGRWVHPADDNSVFEVTEDLCDKLIANFANKVNGDFIPVLDDGHDAPPDKTVGQIMKLEKGSDGLYGVIEARDPKFKERIDRKLVPGVSAAILTDYRDNQTKESKGPVMRHLAVCNEPYIKNLRQWEPVEPVTLSDNSQYDVLYFSEEQPMKIEELKRLLKEKHNIDLDEVQKNANDAAALATKVTDLEVKLSEALKKTGNQPPVDIEKHPKFVELQSNHTTLKQALDAEAARVTELMSKIKKTEAVAKVEVYFQQGKIKPADKQVYVDLMEKDEKTAKTILESLPKVVELEEIGITGGSTSPLSAKLSADDAQKKAKEIADNFLPKAKARPRDKSTAA